MNLLNFPKYFFVNIYEKIHDYCKVREHEYERKNQRLINIPSVNASKLVYKQGSSFADDYLRKCITSRYNRVIQNRNGCSTYRITTNDSNRYSLGAQNVEKVNKKPIDLNTSNYWLSMRKNQNSNIYLKITNDRPNCHVISGKKEAKVINQQIEDSKHRFKVKQIVPILNISSIEKRNSELLTYRENFSFSTNRQSLNRFTKSPDKPIDNKEKPHIDLTNVNMLLLSAYHDRTIQNTKAKIEMLTLYTNQTHSRHMDTKFHIIEEGSFGRVYKGRYNNKDVAVKIPNINTMKSDPFGVTDRILREWKLLAKITHPNIIGFKGGIILPNKHIWLITDFIRGCDLHSLNYKFKYKIPTGKAIKMIKQLIKVLDYLHTPIKEKGIIIHRDIKPENIIIDHYNWDIYLCDFGDAEEFGSGNKRRLSGATWLYSPIELLNADPLGSYISIKNSSQYNEKWDIWSFGCVLQEFFGCPNPFEYIVDFSDSSNVIYSKIVKAVRDNRYIPNISTDIHPRIRKVIEMCLQPDPRLRPSAKNIIKIIDEIL
ncbi:Ser/Thr protein kinase [Cryptosporidium canis]|uniref:Ser/Thr protein kinase n=1 Tax=Cryptosporidium canis TaxID=195482 RepID=A0ABQ8PC87_9CRYT|nr:Ser/Thr protein kinase [Cryptosporidium canis]KAJ1615302.1 Ser/Thr protein kinase [Cryptosporidium canis]